MPSPLIQYVFRVMRRPNLPVRLVVDISRILLVYISHIRGHRHSKLSGAVPVIVRKSRVQETVPYHLFKSSSSSGSSLSSSDFNKDPPRDGGAGSGVGSSAGENGGNWGGFVVVEDKSAGIVIASVVIHIAAFVF